jgi:hypothetical protein
VASEGIHPFDSPPIHVVLLVEGGIPRRLKAFHEMLIAKGLELRPVAYDITVDITEGNCFPSAPIRL